MFDFGQIKQKRNILMTSLFRRDCVCQSSALHEHTMVIYIDSTAAYNTHGQFIKTGPWLGLQTCMCNRRRISAPVSMDRACVGWDGPYIKKRLLVTLHALCAFCGKSIYTGKRNFFFFFFFCKVKQDFPLSILFTPFWGIIPKYFLQDETSIQ